MVTELASNPVILSLLIFLERGLCSDADGAQYVYSCQPPTLHPCQGSKHSNIYIYRMTNFPYFISKSLTILLIFSRRRRRSTGHILHLESHCSASVHPGPTRSEEINICWLTSQLSRLIADNCTRFYPPPCCLQEGLKWVLRNVGFHRRNIFSPVLFIIESGPGLDRGVCFLDYM